MKKMNYLFRFPLIIAGIIMITMISCSKKSGSGGDNNDDNNNVPATVTDIDGNIYHTIKIGTQVWLLENLKTTKYRNGDPITNAIDGNAWAFATAGAYCNYNNNAANSQLYGRLYNWFAVNDSRKIAPTGWHVPSYNEWMVLINYLGGETVAGGKLKEAGLSHWAAPNLGADNSSGFTALPGGNRSSSGTFDFTGTYAYWWSSTVHSANKAWAFYVDSNYVRVVIFQDYNVFGYSVRCVMD
jgi:uncharacterized protein (TIGR02145 family)